MLIKEENHILDLIDKINALIPQKKKKEMLKKYLHLLKDLSSRGSFKKKKIKRSLYPNGYS